MHHHPSLTVLALAGTLSIPISTVQAQDASFGCKVLLCAAASNPSWQGTAYCVPVMSQLMQMMSKRGFQWPVCPEAETGAPGHEPFDACPSGATPVTTTGEQGGNQMCAKPRAIKPSGTTSSTTKADIGSLDAERLARHYELTPRPVRTEPYFFEMPDSDGTKRVYFKLN